MPRQQTPSLQRFGNPISTNSTITVLVTQHGEIVTPDHVQILFNDDGSTDILLLLSSEGQYRVNVRCNDRTLVGAT